MKIKTKWINLIYSFTSMLFHIWSHGSDIFYMYARQNKNKMMKKKNSFRLNNSSFKRNKFIWKSVCTSNIQLLVKLKENEKLKEIDFQIYLFRKMLKVRHVLSHTPVPFYEADAVVMAFQFILPKRFFF